MRAARLGTILRRRDQMLAAREEDFAASAADFRRNRFARQCIRHEDRLPPIQAQAAAAMRHVADIECDRLALQRARLLPSRFTRASSLSHSSVTLFGG